MTRVWLALIVAFTVACGSVATDQSRTSARATPSADSALTHYRAIIDADMRTLNKAWDRPPCATRAFCTTYLQQVRDATDALLKDVSELTAPPAVAPLAEQVKAAADHLDVEISAAESELAQPGTNFQKAATAIDTHDVDYAVAQLDCWPAPPTNFGGEGDYSCA